MIEPLLKNEPANFTGQKLQQWTGLGVRAGRSPRKTVNLDKVVTVSGKSRDHTTPHVPRSCQSGDKHHVRPGADTENGNPIRLEHWRGQRGAPTRNGDPGSRQGDQKVASIQHAASSQKPGRCAQLSESAMGRKRTVSLGSEADIGGRISAISALGSDLGRPPPVTGKSLFQSHFAKGSGGDAGIRTLGTGYPVRRFSKPLPSATRPRLRQAA